MKKYGSIALFLFVIIAVNSAFADKNKPELNFPNNKSLFSSQTPSYIVYNKDSTEANDIKSKKKSQNIINNNFITPESAKVFLSDPFFEWKEPQCTKDEPCKLNILELKTEKELFAKSGIISNHFELKILDKNFKPDKFYLFNIIKNNTDGKINRLKCASLSRQFFS